MKRLKDRFVIKEEKGVSLIPAWHATRGGQAVIDSICSTGFANLATTDAGFFGKGIYVTPNAEYSARVYGTDNNNNGIIILCFVAVANVFPVIYEDMNFLLSSSNYANCDAHYAPVVPKNPLNKNECNYYALKANENAVYDEIVVFQKTQIIPRYVVHFKKKF